jgi:integrase
LDPLQTKNEDGRTVAIHDHLLKLLELWPTKPQGSGEGKYVFTYRGKPIKGDIRAKLKKACASAGILYGRFVRGGFVLHDLRRTFVTYLADAGERDKVIMALAGHVTPSMLLRYDRPSPERKQKAVNLLPSVPAGITKSINTQTEEGPPQDDPSSITT